MDIIPTPDIAFERTCPAVGAAATWDDIAATSARELARPNESQTNLTGLVDWVVGSLR
jgi:hypothetical protein